MPKLSTALTTARRNTQEFLRGFRRCVREYFKSARLIWRVIRFAVHMSKRKVATSNAWVNTHSVRAAFVDGCKSGSYEFYTPLRFTWRFIRTGFGKVISKLDRKYLNVTESSAPDYSKMTVRESVSLGAKRGFLNYFALHGDIYRWLRRNRTRR